MRSASTRNRLGIGSIGEGDTLAVSSGNDTGPERESAARVSLGEVLDRAEKLEASTRAEEEAKASLDRDRTIRSKKGRESTDESREEAKSRRVKKAQSLGLGLKSMDAGDEGEEEGMVPPPSSGLPTRGSSTKTSKSGKDRSISPTPSNGSISFADTLPPRQQHRTVSTPLVGAEKQKRGKKFSDGSLSDGGKPAGMGFAGRAKKLKKARSFSDVTRISWGPVGGSPHTASGDRMDGNGDKEEMLSPTPPAVLTPTTADSPISALTVPAPATEVKQKRKRSGSGGLLKAAAGFLGLRRDKGKEKAKASDDTIKVLYRTPEQSATATFTDSPTESPLEPPPRQTYTLPLSTPPRTRPLIIPGASTPQGTSTLTPSLTIRARKRTDSKPAKTDGIPTTPLDTSEMKTPSISVRNSSLGYFPAIENYSSEPSPAVSPGEEFGSLRNQKAGWFGSLTSGSPVRLERMPKSSARSFDNSTPRSLGPYMADRKRTHSDLASSVEPDVERLSKSAAAEERDFGQLFGGGGGGGGRKRSNSSTARPGMGERSNSAGPPMMGKVKQVFVGSTASRRGRSGSLLRDVTAPNSFISSPQTPNLVLSPAASTVSLASSFTGRMSRQTSFDIATYPEVTFSEKPATPRRNTLSPNMEGLASVYERQPRQSTSSSMLSSTNSQTIPESSESPPPTVKKDTGRKRSSTLFSTPPRVKETSMFGTPTRLRPASRRLSTGFFGKTPSQDSLLAVDSSLQRARPPPLILEPEKKTAKLVAPPVGDGDTAETWLEKVQAEVREADLLHILAAG